MNRTADSLGTDVPALSGEEALSRSEAEQLLAQVVEPRNETSVQLAGGLATPAKSSGQPYDFRNPVFLPASQLRRLRSEHEEFIHALAARLSIYLRMEFALQMTRLETMTYQKFKGGLGSPTHLTMLKTEPLRGVCILDINPGLGLAMVDRLLGGSGHAVSLSRDLSEIEVALLDQVVHIVFGEWCNHWSSLQEIRHQVVGHENNPQFLQTMQPDAVILVLSMEARIADCLEQIQIGFPYNTVEPLIEKLGGQLRPDAEEPDEAVNAHRWNPELADVNIPVTAEWPPVFVKASELACLQVGDVVPIPAEFANQVQIKLARMKKFCGRLGTKGNNWAVEVQQILPT